MRQILAILTFLCVCFAVNAQDQEYPKVQLRYDIEYHWIFDTNNTWTKITPLSQSVREGELTGTHKPTCFQKQITTWNGAFTDDGVKKVIEFTLPEIPSTMPNLLHQAFQIRIIRWIECLEDKTLNYFDKFGNPVTHIFKAGEHVVFVDPKTGELLTELVSPACDPVEIINILPALGVVEAIIMIMSKYQVAFP